MKSKHLPTTVYALIVATLLVSCSDRDDLAPVTELKWRYINSQDKQYVVVRGDTLYSIAFRYDLDFRQLAEYNRLRSPYVVRVGQVLQLRPTKRLTSIHASSPSSRPVYKQAPRRSTATPMLSTGSWIWPARGKVSAHFSPDRGMKGIVITGKQGDKIYAASSGVVAYAGNGLVGYGNLIIIKHGHQFLTAYGNNMRNLVHEGQMVSKGQVIADMGVIDRRYWAVHFEIRRLGKPVDPLSYLK